MMTSKVILRDYDVKNVRAFEENGRWFLDLMLEYEDAHRKDEIHIPKVELDFFNAELGCVAYDNYAKCTRTFIEFASSRFNLHKDADGHLYTVKKTNKPEKLTLEDVEERLGYKVELVTKKGD